MLKLIQIIGAVFAFFAVLLALATIPVSSLQNAFAPKSAEHASILFGGDIMLDRSIRSVADALGGDFIFSCLDPLLSDADLVVANLEGPITNHPSKSMDTVPEDQDNMTFTFPTSSASLLFKHNIRIVNIGNNHIENFGKEGVLSTITALTDARVGYFGDPIGHTLEARDIGSISLAFIGYNEFDSSGSAYAASTTVMHIQEARDQGKLPIVYAHWGDEYLIQSSTRIRQLARTFVDSGAELVIGSHPHVVGEREFYSPTGETGQEKYIYYSLGNLIFDQYWDEHVSRGLMVRAVFDSKGVVYVEEIPVRLERDGRTCLF